MKLLARLLLVAGALGLGWFLFRAAPRDVVLVYGVSALGAPATLEVEVRRGPDLVRRAELLVPPGGGEVRHPLRLPDGAYVVSWRLAAGAKAWRGERPLDVSEDATLVVPLGP